MTHLSRYLSHVQIAQLDQFLLLQTIRGAVDVVPGEMMRDLMGFGGPRPDLLSEPEVEALKRRGYLTELSAAEESEQARAILRVLSGNLQRLVELDFVFPTDAERATSPAVAGGALVDELFSLAYEMAGEQGRVIANLEIPSARVDADAVASIIETAQSRDSVILPQLTFDGLDAIKPWLKSENFRNVIINSDAANMPAEAGRLADDIVSLFDRQVHPSWKCQVDGMSAAQLEAVALIYERVRQKYSFFRINLVSDRMDETAPPASVAAGGVGLPCISADNETVFGTLLSLVFGPSQINYKPFFEPESHKLTCAVDTGRVTYRAGGGEESEGLDAARAQLGEAMARVPSDVSAAVARAAEGELCKYALVCGCRRGVNGCPAVESGQCAALYERRLHQVLPLLMYNLRKRGATPQHAASAGSE